MPVLESKPGAFLDGIELGSNTFPVEAKGRALPAHGQSMPAKLFIEPDQPRRLEIIIHLVTTDIVIGQEPAAELEAAIDRALAIDARLKFQFEVCQLPSLPDEILVHRA